MTSTLLRVASCLALLACLPSAAPVESTADAVIQDAAHGGRAGFYFLPPLVEATPLPPAFDAGLTLVGRLEQQGSLVASFPFVVRPLLRRYVGLLDTGDLDLDPERVYRVRVLAGALELGWADVRVFKTRREARSEATGETFELVDGRILRVPVYVNRCAAVTCDGASACREAASCDGRTGQCLPGAPIPCSGELEVSAGVDEVAASGADLALEAEVGIDGSSALPAAPGALASYWPPAGASGLTLAIAGEVGAWTQRSGEEACAPLALALAAGGGAPAAFADLVEESRGVAELCVAARDGAGVLELRMSRDGAPRTAALAATGVETLHVEISLTASLPRTAFDGRTLDLRVLDGAHGPLPLAGELAVDGVAPWYRARLGGAAGFDFIATAE